MIRRIRHTYNQHATVHPEPIRLYTSMFTPNLTFAGPLSIRFGYNDWSVGIDNINFDQVTAAPESETYAMLLARLGLVGFMARRRKRTV